MTTSVKRIEYDGYEIVALARGQEVVYFRQFGSYQGEWLLVSHKDETYYIYKDSHGSCSGCDSLEAANLDRYGDEPGVLPDDIDLLKFIEDYQPCSELSREVAVSFILRGEFLELFPANIRTYEYGDISAEGLAGAALQVALLIKSREGIIKAREILDIRNAEQRREAMDRYGTEHCMNDLDATVLHTDGDNYLCSLERPGEELFVFLNVKDTSTPRRYLIRVPPTMERVKQALAWTFDLKEEEYVLEQES